MSEEIKQPRKKVGLALSGGFVRATAAIGALEVLRMHNIPVDMVAGCSAGSAIGGAYVSGNLETIKHGLINGTRRDYFQVIVEPGNPREGILKGQRTKEWLRKHVGDKNFEDTDIPFYITTTNLKTLSPAVINKGKIVEAVQASIGVPGLWSPVKVDGMFLSDGGNFNQIPSAPLYENGADYVIAFDVTKPPHFITQLLSNFDRRYRSDRERNFSDRNDIFNFVRRAIYLSTTKIENFHHTSYKYDLLIKPRVSKFRRYHVGKVADIIEEGRKATEKMIPQIKKDLGLE